MKAEVRTVLGPISPTELGFTSMHEHVLLDVTCYRRSYEDRIPAEDRPLWDSPLSIETLWRVRRNALLLRDNLCLDDEAQMAGELAEYRESGGGALLDVSAVGIRRDVAAVRRLSAATGVHIVASTGFYVEPSWPEDVDGWTTARFAEHMTAEIMEGIGDSGVRAGHIKVGVTDLSDAQRRLLAAAARAAGETGASITVHPGAEPANDGLAASQILIDQGVEPGRIVIAHTDNRLPLADGPQPRLDDRLPYHRALLERGVTISLDGFGMVGGWEAVGFRAVPDWLRYAAVAALARDGFGDQIVLGADVAYKSATLRFGGPGYANLPRSVVPMLRLLGVSEMDLRRMTVHTPAALLAIE